MIMKHFFFYANYLSAHKMTSEICETVTLQKQVIDK